MNEKIITLKNLEKIAEWIKSKFENKANKDEIPTSLPADGGNADTVGGKSAEELIQSNPNLLLNPDFKVNQRGKSEYGYDGSDRYTVDRWKLQANLTLTVHDDYITVSRHDPTSNSHTGFRQDLNIPDDTSVTLQACVKGNGSFTLFYNGFNGTSETQVQDTDGWVVVKCTGYGASEVGVLLRGTATSLDIKWIKLELGAVSTPFVPPNPLEEALKCGSLENAEQQIFYGDGVWANAPSNPNLLDNPDFKINQRGKSEYTAGNTNVYTVDRWKVRSNNTCIVEEGGIIVRNNADSALQLYQYIDRSFKDLAGKRLTMSVKIANDETVRSVSGTVPLVAPTDSSYIMHIVLENGFTLGMWYSTEVKRVVYQIIKSKSTNGESIKIEWAKCEMGAALTPFTPPDPATELLKCQRYYQQLGRMMAHIGSGFISGNTNDKNAVIICPLRPMRIVSPTIILRGTMYINTYKHQGASAIPSTAFTSSAGCSQNALILPVAVTTDDVGVLGQGATLQFRDADSYIGVSADL